MKLIFPAEISSCSCRRNINACCRVDNIFERVKETFYVIINSRDDNLDVGGDVNVLQDLIPVGIRIIVQILRRHLSLQLIARKSHCFQFYLTIFLSQDNGIQPRKV
jgi:hypothetical protein